MPLLGNQTRQNDAEYKNFKIKIMLLYGKKNFLYFKSNYLQKTLEDAGNYFA